RNTSTNGRGPVELEHEPAVNDGLELQRMPLLHAWRNPKWHMEISGGTAGGLSFWRGGLFPTKRVTT
ncbi:MAG: hypothetical protein ACM3N3_19575, partial [Betaproteobacteria bacterium]